MAGTWAFVGQTAIDFIFEDVNQKKVRVRTFVDGEHPDGTASPVSDIYTKIRLLSWAGLTTIECGLSATGSGFADPTDGPYDRVQDKMLMEFRASDGSTVKFNLPTINEGMLESDEVTLDPTATEVVTLVNLLLANARDSEGNSLVALTKTYRRRASGLKHH